jgi:hypothetical protein
LGLIGFLMFVRRRHGELDVVDSDDCAFGHEGIVADGKN